MNFLLVVFISLHTCIFASSDAKADVDQYITGLRRFLPEFPAGCFVNVCDEDAKMGVNELYLPHSKYFFVNQSHIVESSRVALEVQMGVDQNVVVFANLAASLSDWMECRLQRFDVCVENNTKKIQQHRSDITVHENDRLLARMSLYYRDSFLKACLSDVVNTRKQQRSRSVLRGGGRREISAIDSSEVKTPAVTISEEKGETTGTTNTKATEGVVESSSIPCMSSAIDYSAIAKGLTPQQLAALDRAYAGQGMSFEEKYNAACRDGLFTELRNPSPRRDVSRSTGKMRSISKSPVKQRTTESETLDSRFSSPARARPFEIFYESTAVQKTYDDFFKRAENNAAKTHFNDFMCAISTRGLIDYVGKMERFHSISGAYKFSVGDKARVIFRRGEGDSIVLIGNPDHYGEH